MRHLLNLVLVCLVAVTGRALVQGTELCEQDLEFKMDLCSYIDSIAKENRNLLTQVMSKATDEVFPFQVPQNVTSLEDFYQVLIKYQDTLRGLNSSLASYMATPQYVTESQLIAVAVIANNYIERMKTSFINLGDTLDFMLEIINMPSQLVTPTVSATDATKNKESIYAETYYVTKKMAGPFLTWRQKCITCGLTRRRRAVRGN